MVMINTATVMTSTGQECLDRISIMAVNYLGIEPQKAREMVGAAHARLGAWRFVARGISDLARAKRRSMAKEQLRNDGSPLVFRATHHPFGIDESSIVLLQTAISDAHEKIGAPFRVIDTLAALHDRNKITDIEYDHGRDFEQLFIVSGLDNLRASSFFRLPMGAGGAKSLSHAAISAREQLWEFFNFFGGSTSRASMALCCIVGYGMSFKEFAIRTREQCGLTERKASAVLIKTLQQLPEAPWIIDFDVEYAINE